LSYSQVAVIHVGRDAAPSLDIQNLRKRYAGKVTEDSVLKEDVLFESAGLSHAADMAFSFACGLMHFFGRRGFDTWETSGGKSLLEVCKEDGYPIPWWEEDSD
jgi:transketolase C-terminal domain/subunit